MIMGKLLSLIQGCAITLDDDGVIRFLADADIDSDGGPNVDHDPYWQPDTTLHLRGKPINSQVVPYAVIPIGILNKVRPIGLGCQVRVTNRSNGKSCDAVLADLGPTRKIGEISAECARRLGVNPNSVRGGTEKRIIFYEVYLGIPAIVVGISYKLQPLHG